MRRFCSVLFVLVLLILQCHHAPGVAAHSGIYQVNAGLGLNLRTGPSGDFPRLYTMPNGRLVTAMGHRGNWLKLRDRVTGTVGWAWLAYFVPYSGQTSGGGGSAGGGAGYCMTTYWHEYVCASPNVADAIRYWFGVYGIGSWWGFATASCESNFNIYAYNPASGVTGLFQFQPSTFYWQGGHDLYDPWDQSRIAAKMFASGLGSMFACAVLQGW